MNNNSDQHRDRVERNYRSSVEQHNMLMGLLQQVAKSHMEQTIADLQEEECHRQPGATADDS